MSLETNAKQTCPQPLCPDASVESRNKKGKKIEAKSLKWKAASKKPLPLQTITSEDPPNWKSNVLSTITATKIDPDFYINRNGLLLLCLGVHCTPSNG